MFEVANEICTCLKDGNISFILAIWGRDEKFYDGKFPCGFPNLMVGASIVLNNVLGGLKADIDWSLEKFMELCRAPSFDTKTDFDVELEFDLIYKNRIEILTSCLRPMGYNFLLVVPTRLNDGDFGFEVFKHNESITAHDKICALASDLVLQTLDPDVCDFIEALGFSATDIKTFEEDV